MAGFNWRTLLRAFRFWSPDTAIASGAAPVPSAAIHEASPVLVGRDAALKQIATKKTGTVVVAGDPGVGKTEVATHAAARTLGAPAPISITYRQGALQTVLFSSLAEALALDAASRGSTERMMLIFGEAARRFAGTRLEDVSLAARQVMVGVARDKMGDTLVDLAGDMFDAVNTTIDEQLIRRVTQASDPDAIEVFRGLAREAAQLMENPIVLTLDTAEKMHEDDFAQLLDLTTEPSDAVVRAVIATRDDRTARQVRELRVAGADVIPIEPLGDKAVYEWLTSEEIVGPTADDIVRTTLGYPLFVVAAIEHVETGRSTGHLRGHDGFVAQMEMNFHALNQAEQHACVALAGFTDPPGVDMIATLLECTAADWLDIEGRLAEKKIFPTAVDGRLWFHELGRRAIWDAAMTLAQREASAEAAIDLIMEVVQAAKGSSFQEAVDVAHLFASAPAAAEKHEGVEAVVGLSPDKLGLYGALLELTEEQSPSLDPSAVVQHARQSFRRSGDLEGQLRGLQEAGLAVLAENAQAAVVVGVWPSLASTMVLVGRVSEELGRRLIPKAATATFEHLLRPRIGNFNAAMFGVGDPDLVERSSTLREMDVDRDGQTVAIHRRHGLIGRGRWGGVALHYAFNFEGVGDRDQALVALNGLVEERYFGSSFAMDSVIAWPQPEPLPELRLVQGALLATAYHAETNLSFDLKVKIAPPMPSVGDHLRARVACESVLRHYSDPLTGHVLRLEQAKGYVYAKDGRRVLVAETRGSNEVIEIPTLVEPFAPFARTRMSEIAELPHDASIGRMTLYSGGLTNDPLASALNDCRKRLKAFNDQQRHARKSLLLDEPTLTHELWAAMEARAQVAMAFLETGLIAKPHPGGPFRHLRVLVRPGRQEAGWVPGAHGTVTWTSVPAAANRVDVEVATAGDEADWQLEDFQGHFGLEGVELQAYSHSVLIGGLAKLLGFADNRLSLDIPVE